MARYVEYPGGYQMDSSQDEDWEEEEEDMARTRYEISIAFNDKAGVRRYANQRGTLWLDTEAGKGNIELPPGTALVGGEGYYINVELPRERGAATPAAGGGRQHQPRGGRQHQDDDEIPF